MKNSGEKTRSQGSKTADRTLRVLNILADCNIPMSAMDVAKLVPCSRNAAYRSLVSLLNAGFVISGEQPGKFKLSLKTARLNRQQLSRTPQLAVIQSVIDGISAATGESCNYEELQGVEVVILARSVGSRDNPFNFEIGQSTPAASTSIGRAILSHRHRRDAAKLLELGLTQHTSFTQTNPFKYLKELDEVQKTKYAIDDQELVMGLRCISVPILVPDKVVNSGLAICGPIERFSISYMERLAKNLMEGSHYLASLLKENKILEHTVAVDHRSAS